MPLDPDDQSEEFKAYQESVGAEELPRDHVAYMEPKTTQKRKVITQPDTRFHRLNDKMS